MFTNSLQTPENSSVWLRGADRVCLSGFLGIRFTETSWLKLTCLLSAGLLDNLESDSFESDNLESDKLLESFESDRLLDNLESDKLLDNLKSGRLLENFESDKLLENSD